MRDNQILAYIKQHYNEILDELKIIDDCQAPYERSTVEKAIKMDVFQIGELANKLTDETKAKLGGKDLRGIINIRNFVGHAYLVVDDDIIYDSIKNDIPRLIADLEKNLNQ